LPFSLIVSCFPPNLPMKPAFAEKVAMLFAGITTGVLMHTAKHSRHLKRKALRPLGALLPSSSG